MIGKWLQQYLQHLLKSQYCLKSDPCIYQGGRSPPQTWFPNILKIPLYLHMLRFIDFLCMSGPFTKKLEHPMWVGLNLVGIFQLKVLLLNFEFVPFF